MEATMDTVQWTLREPARPLPAHEYDDLRVRLIVLESSRDRDQSAIDAVLHRLSVLRGRLSYDLDDDE